MNALIDVSGRPGMLGAIRCALSAMNETGAEPRPTDRLDQLYSFPVLGSRFLSGSTACAIIDSCLTIARIHKAFTKKHTRQVVFPVVTSCGEVVCDGVVYQLFLLRREFAFAKVNG